MISRKDRGLCRQSMCAMPTSPYARIALRIYPSRASARVHADSERERLRFADVFPWEIFRWTTGAATSATSIELPYSIVEEAGELQDSCRIRRRLILSRSSDVNPRATAFNCYFVAGKWPKDSDRARISFFV